MGGLTAPRRRSLLQNPAGVLAGEKQANHGVPDCDDRPDPPQLAHGGEIRLESPHTPQEPAHPVPEQKRQGAPPLPPHSPQTAEPDPLHVSQ